MLAQVPTIKGGLSPVTAYGMRSYNNGARAESFAFLTRSVEYGPIRTVDRSNALEEHVSRVAFQNTSREHPRPRPVEIGIKTQRNSGSSLGFHTDRVDSHIISGILHVAHQYDDDSVTWPIEIEGHDGPTTHTHTHTHTHTRAE